VDNEDVEFGGSEGSARPCFGLRALCCDGGGGIIRCGGESEDGEVAARRPEAACGAGPSSL
jgi:hypothetical protein